MYPGARDTTIYFPTQLGGFDGKLQVGQVTFHGPDDSHGTYNPSTTWTKEVEFIQGQGIDRILVTRPPKQQTDAEHLQELLGK